MTAQPTCTHNPLARSKDGTVCFACQFQAKYPTLEAAKEAAERILAKAETAR